MLFGHQNATLSLYFDHKLKILPWILTMKRLVGNHLLNWKQDPYRKPLLIRGARQSRQNIRSSRTRQNL